MVLKIKINLTDDTYYTVNRHVDEPTVEYKHKILNCVEKLNCMGFLWENT